MLSTPYQRSILLVLVCAILLLSFFIIRPLLTPILAGIILAYLFFPFYDFLLKQHWLQCCPKNEKLARLFVVFAIILILLAPVLTLLLLLFWHMHSLTSLLGSFFNQLSDLSNTLIVFLDQGPFKGLAANLDARESMSFLYTGLFKVIQELVKQIPQFILGSFITLFIVYYLLRDAAKITTWIIELIPLKKAQLAFVLNRFNGLGRGLIASQLAIAIIQALLMAIACLILGIPHFIFISLLTFVLAIIPFLGAIIVWVGITIFLFMEYSTGGALWRPIFMLIYGTALVSMIDNFIRPKMLASASELNPALTLIGFLGGFMLFGIPGVFLGPFILGLVELAIEVYKEVA